MYSIALGVHDIIRWLVLAAAVWALFRAYRGWLGSRDWTPGDKRASTWLTMSVDIQFLVGLILVVVSPLTRAALGNPGGIMSTDMLRFFVVEHIPVMVAAVILIHVVSMLSGKAPTDSLKHRRAAIGYSLAVLAIIVAIPWWRPLLPWV